MYGVTTAENRNATVGTPYHYYDEREVRSERDSLQGTGALISSLARREPRLRLHPPPAKRWPEARRLSKAELLAHAVDPLVDVLAATWP